MNNFNQLINKNFDYLDNEKISGVSKNNCKVISIASGKGGVGKTLSTINLALILSQKKKSVLILDGDLGLANVDVVLGLRGRYNISDVISKKVPIKDIIIDGPLGIKIIPSGSGLFELGNLSYLQRIYVLNQLNDLKKEFDFLIIDSGAGISETTLHLNGISTHKIIVTTSEPHAMTDAYAFIKVMTEQYGTDIDVHLLVNLTKSENEGLKIFKKISEVARNFINLDVKYLGDIPFDPQLNKLIRGIGSFADQSCHTVSYQAWSGIIDPFLGYVNNLNQKKGIAKDFCQLLERTSSK